MKGVRFLTTEQVLEIHREMIDRYGGEGAIRNLGLIDSAVAMPRQTFGGKNLHPSIPAMAAAYLCHLCSNHGFVDGNKRTAAAAALVFLDANRFELALTIDELERLTVDVASSRLDKTCLIEIFEAGSRRRSTRRRS